MLVCSVEGRAAAVGLASLVQCRVAVGDETVSVVVLYVVVKGTGVAKGFSCGFSHGARCDGQDEEKRLGTAGSGTHPVVARQIPKLTGSGGVQGSEAVIHSSGE